MSTALYLNSRTTRFAASANTSTPRRPRRFSSARTRTAQARTCATLFRAAPGARHFPLIELNFVSSPLVSAIELVGQRLVDDNERAGNLSPLANRSVPSSCLVANELPFAVESPVSGHRDCKSAPLDIEAARDVKSVPKPAPEAAPARSAQLVPIPLTPQVRELSPLLFDPVIDGNEKPVPIDPVPVPTPAVVVAYSPIVCA